ncbi:MAG: hypothetical protein ABI653_01500, partial [Bacteroidota bacterium]
KPWYANKNTDIIIDGFPRSANTYATFAFDTVQNQKFNIAHHIHKKSQFLIGAKYKIPAILLIRNPSDCIVSTLIRQPKYNPETLLAGYFYMYNSLQKMDSYVVGEFSQVLNNYGLIIRNVNSKFGTEFNIYEKSDFNETKVKEIVQSQDELKDAADYEQRVAYPTEKRKEDKQRLKKIIQQPKYSKQLGKCTGVYEKIISTSNI